MQKKRFYDQEPTTSRAVELLLVFPPDLQSVIADGISMLAEQTFKISDMLKELKSLGTENVLAFYKSKQRKRDYDQIPAVHKAINDLMILTPENRIFMARKILGLMTHLQEYLRACKRHASVPSVSTIRETIHLYARYGASEAAQHLRGMEAVLVSQGSQIRPMIRKQLTQPVNGPEIVSDEIAGLRLRQNNQDGVPD